METGRVSIDSQILTDIADSIRSKNGETSHYYPQNMAGKIDNILVPSGTLEITSNGVYDVTQYASADVQTPGITPTGTINITQNGTTDVTTYATANVNVPSNPLEYITATVPQGSSVNNPGAIKIIKKVVGVTPASNNLQFVFSNCIGLEEVQISEINNVTSMDSCFYNCSALQSVLLTGTFNSLSNTSAMFSGCTSLTSISAFNLSNVNNATNMFRSCSSLTTLPTLNFTNLLTQSPNMFNGCSNLVTIPLFNTSGNTYMNSMFQGCTSLVNVPEFNLSSMTNANLLGDMFKNCTSLSNESLANIMNSLAGSSVNSGTMTLAHIGLNQTQATYCASLPIWSTLTTAGWTTGY